ncbi:MAG: HEAT repeat domain-containing protein [Phycisphaera sp.]|nr:MAG: HEAT repeat domain-containing protein [Phycisphaera sp.]
MHRECLLTTSYLVGKHRYISGCVVALALCAPMSHAQQVVFVPSCEPLVHVLESSYSSSDPREREAAIAWLRERRTPAAYQVLYRAKSDPSPAVRAQSLLGLAEIASECALDSFQMRHLEPDERADLITLGSEAGLIDLHALRSVAMDSSAGDAERASALIELMKLGKQVDAESWLPLLGSDDESIQMLAALSVMTPAPKTRPVAVAQDHATNILRKGVRDASEGRIASVVQTLAIARKVPTVHLSHWAAALLKACNEKPSPECRLVSRESLRALLAVDPNRAGLRVWWTDTFEGARAESSALTPIAFWALEGASRQHVRGYPAWIVDDIERAGQTHGGFIAACADAIRSLTEERKCTPEQIARLASTGGDPVKRLALQLVDRLPHHERTRALTLLVQSEAGGSEPWFARHAARLLVEADPIGAQVVLTDAHAMGKRQIATALVLAGVWCDEVSNNPTLRLVRSLWLAEREVEGNRTEARAELANELMLIVDPSRGFAAPIRAEAAWLALVLRDQTSEALAHLPKPRNASPDESSPRPGDADSLEQWAQMQYP